MQYREINGIKFGMIYYKVNKKMKIDKNVWFLCQYYFVLNFGVMLGWHIKHFRAVIYWFRLPYVFLSTLFLILYAVGIIFTELKMMKNPC